MEDVLVLQGLGITLRTQPSTLSAKEWAEAWVHMQARELSMIRLHLSLEVLLHVLSFNAPIKLWD